jgi:hypothetical protein
MTKSEPSQNPSFYNKFYDIEAPKKIKAQLGGEAAFSRACAIGAFIGLHCQKCIKKELGFGLG